MVKLLSERAVNMNMRRITLILSLFLAATGCAVTQPETTTTTVIPVTSAPSTTEPATATTNTAVETTVTPVETTSPDNPETTQVSAEAAAVFAALDSIPVAASRNEYDSNTMRATWETVADGCRTRDAQLIEDATDEADEFVTVGENCTIETLVANDPYTGTVYEYDRLRDGNTVRLDTEHIHPWGLIVEGMSPALYSEFLTVGPRDMFSNLYNWDESLNPVYGTDVQHSNLLSVDPTGNRVTHNVYPLNDGWIGELPNGENIRCDIATRTVLAVADMNRYVTGVNPEFNIGMSEGELLWLDFTLRECYL